MSSEPIILKSKSQELRCSYQRPYKFLIDGVKGEPYKLIDYHDSQASYIEVKGISSHISRLNYAIFRSIPLFPCRQANIDSEDYFH